MSIKKPSKLSCAGFATGDSSALVMGTSGRQKAIRRYNSIEGEETGGRDREKKG
jgi:hypothetical protein